MRRSRMGGVEEVSLGAPGHQDDGLAAPGMYSGSPGVAFDPRRAQRQDQRFGGLGAGGNYAGPGVSFDPDTNLNGAAEPVMTLSGGGRVARRRSFGGQLRREARQYARRSQLAGLGLTTGDPCKCPAGTPMAGQMSKYVGAYMDTCICGQKGWGEDAFEYVGQVAINTINSQAGTDFKGPQDDKSPTPSPTPSPTNTVNLKSIINQRLSQGKVAPKKSSKVVPIVAGAAVIGLLIWAL